MRVVACACVRVALCDSLALALSMCRCSELTDAAALIKDLSARGFCTVNAAEYTTAEKAVLFSQTKVAVIELGAGLTNLLFVAEVSLSLSHSDSLHASISLRLALLSAPHPHLCFLLSLCLCLLGLHRHPDLQPSP